MTRVSWSLNSSSKANRRRGKVPLLEALRGVDSPERRRAPGEAEVVDEPPRQDLGQLPGALKGLGDVGGDLDRADLGLARLRVDRDDAARLVTHEVDDGIGHLASAPVDLGASEDDDLGALGQLTCPPGLVEEDDRQTPRGIFDQELNHRPAAPQVGEPRPDARSR